MTTPAGRPRRPLTFSIVRRCSLAVASGLGVAATGSVAAAAPPSTCLHGGEHVIARGAVAKVVATSRTGATTVRGDRAFLCRYSDKKRLRIGRAIDELTIRTMRVGGLYVAYESAYNADGVERGTVLMLRSFVPGHRQLVLDAGYPADQAGAFSSIVLRKTGSVAYIGHHDYSPSIGVYRCQPVGCRAHGTPEPELLAGPDGLDPRSLRTTIGGVSWIANGATSQAPLR